MTIPPLLDQIMKLETELKAHGVVVSRLDLTPSTYARLKEECEVKQGVEPNSLFGIEIVVHDKKEVPDA